MKQAIPLYQKSIELLREPKDTAMAWNRLGNAHRKLNQYEQALEAFHKADELDRDNAGFRDSLDEASDAPTVMQFLAVPGEPIESVSTTPSIGCPVGAHELTPSQRVPSSPELPAENVITMSLWSQTNSSTPANSSGSNVLALPNTLGDGESP